MPALIHLLIEQHRRASHERLLRYFSIEWDEHLAYDRATVFLHLRPRMLHLRTPDIESLGPHARELVRLLYEEASVPTRNRVLSQWKRLKLTAVPDFAETLLSVGGEDLHQHALLMDNIRASLFPVALRDAPSHDHSSSHLRELLARHFPLLVQASPALTVACERDRARAAREEEAREREKIRREEDDRTLAARREAVRQARLDEITALPLLQRVELLLAGGVGVNGPYPLEWAAVSAAEMESLSPDRRRDLIRRLRFKRNEVCRAIRFRLLAPDRRAQMQQREELEATLRDKPIDVQLAHLAHSTLPPGKYPAQLAARALEELLTISPSLQSRVLHRLSGQRRGVWRSLLEALRAEVGARTSQDKDGTR